MKRTVLILSLLFLFNLSFSQEENDSEELFNTTDTAKLDSIYSGNLIGLNVYPAFGMIGGGRLPASKIFVQYKHNWLKSSIRLSANYINFRSIDKRLDIVDVSENITIRKYSNNFYSFDGRFGYERALPFEQFRFYYGMGAIGGYYHYSKSYYNYSVEAESYPVEGITAPTEMYELGWYRAEMLKLGLDFSIGVSIPLAESVFLSVQYTPELTYYHIMNKTKDDDANVFEDELIGDDFMDFRGDYIDLILSVKL